MFYTSLVSVSSPMMGHEGPKHLRDSVHRSISICERQTYIEG